MPKLFVPRPHTVTSREPIFRVSMSFLLARLRDAARVGVAYDRSIPKEEPDARADGAGVRGTRIGARALVHPRVPLRPDDVGAAAARRAREDQDRRRGRPPRPRPL